MFSVLPETLLQKKWWTNSKILSLGCPGKRIRSSGSWTLFTMSERKSHILTIHHAYEAVGNPISVPVVLPRKDLSWGLQLTLGSSSCRWELEGDHPPGGVSSPLGQLRSMAWDFPSINDTFSHSALFLLHSRRLRGVPLVMHEELKLSQRLLSGLSAAFVPSPEPPQLWGSVGSSYFKLFLKSQWLRHPAVYTKPGAVHAYNAPVAISLSPPGWTPLISIVKMPCCHSTLLKTALLFYSLLYLSQSVTLEAWDIPSLTCHCGAAFNITESTFLPSVPPFGAAGPGWHEFGSLLCRSAAVPERQMGYLNIRKQFVALTWWNVALDGRMGGWLKSLWLGASPMGRVQNCAMAGFEGLWWENKGKGIRSGGKRDCEISRWRGKVIWRIEPWFILRLSCRPWQIMAHSSNTCSCLGSPGEKWRMIITFCPLWFFSLYTGDVPHQLLAKRCLELEGWRNRHWGSMHSYAAKGFLCGVFHSFLRPKPNSSGNWSCFPDGFSGPVKVWLSLCISLVRRAGRRFS